MQKNININIDLNITAQTKEDLVFIADVLKTIEGYNVTNINTKVLSENGNVGNTAVSNDTNTTHNVVPVSAVQNPELAVPTTPPAVDSVPTANTSFTVDDLIRAAQPLVSSIGLNSLRDLLSKYGVVAINQLQPEQCNAFALDLRALGAAI